MALFCWKSRRQLPDRWDLRRAGWRLCPAGAACAVEQRALRLLDTAGLEEADRFALLGHESTPGLAIALGIDRSCERAALIAAGWGEALAGSTGLAELDHRARRIAVSAQMLPRLRDAGPVTLDLLYRDGRVGARWLALHPREFALLWRIAENCGAPVTRQELLRDVWRLRHVPETNSVQVHVSRLRAKLAAQGLGALVATDPQGGYRLALA